MGALEIVIIAAVAYWFLAK